LALELLDPMNMSLWTILLLSYIEKCGGDKILYLKKEGLESLSDKLNPFWRDILLNLSEMLFPKDEEENSIINILCQLIWLNFNIKRNGIFFLLMTNIVITVSFLLMILSLKITSFCHIRNFKTNI
jgi:hypothetical protein